MKKLRKVLRALNVLQLFAVHVNATTDTTATTGNDLSAEMKTFYDRNLIKMAKAQLVHDQFGQKRPIPKGNGKSIEFRKFAPLAKALTPLTEGVTPDGKSMDVSTVTATVSQYGDFIVQSDVLELTAVDNTILEATDLLGTQAGLTLDTVTRNVLQASTNVFYCSTWSGSTETKVTQRANMNLTSKLTVKMVNKIATYLKRVNAPKIDGYYVAIIHPDVANDLKNDDNWKYPHQYRDTKNLYTGELGEIGGVRFVESSEALIVKDTTCPKIDPSGDASALTNRYAVYSTLFVGAGAYGVTDIEGGGMQTIVKQKGSAGTADPLDQRSSVGWKSMKTAEILIPEYLVRVESLSEEFSAIAAAN